MIYFQLSANYIFFYWNYKFKKCYAMMMMIHFQLYNDFGDCFSFAELKPKYSNILIVTIIIESV